MGKKCEIKERRFNIKFVESLVKEKSASYDGGEACIVAENYTVRFRKIGVVEYDEWVKESGENDPARYASEIEEEMQTNWSKKEGGWDVYSRWLGVSVPDWYYRTSEVFYAVYKKAISLRSIKSGRHLVEGRIFLNYKGEKVHEILVDGNEVDIKTSLAYDNHSPGGFGWGYPGSAPSQSALAILIEILPSDVALFNHMRFMKETTARMDQDKGFMMFLFIIKDERSESFTIHYEKTTPGEIVDGDFKVEMPRF